MKRNPNRESVRLRGPSPSGSGRTTPRFKEIILSLWLRVYYLSPPPSRPLYLRRDTSGVTCRHGSLLTAVRDGRRKTGTSRARRRYRTGFPVGPTRRTVSCSEETHKLLQGETRSGRNTIGSTETSPTHLRSGVSTHPGCHHGALPVAHFYRLEGRPLHNLAETGRRCALPSPRSLSPWTVSVGSRSRRCL